MVANNIPSTIGGESSNEAPVKAGPTGTPLELALDKAMRGESPVNRDEDSEQQNIRTSLEGAIEDQPRTIFTDTDPSIFSNEKMITLPDKNNEPKGYARELRPEGDQENTKMPGDDVLMAAFEKINHEAKPKTDNQINQESLDRQQMLRHFRDQKNLENGESIPQTEPTREAIIPSKADENQSQAKEQSLTFQGGKTLSPEGQNLLNNKENLGNQQENIIKGNSENKPSLSPEQINKQMEAINNVFQQVLIFQENDPYNPQITLMLQQITDMMKNINIAQGRNSNTEKQNGNYGYNIPEVSYVPPKEPEKNKEEERAKERRERKTALIATVVGGATGVGTVLLAGTSVIPHVRAVTAVLAVGSTVVSFGAKIIENNTTKKLLTETDPAKRAQLEKRRNISEKVSRWARNVGAFFGGFGLGLWGGSLIASKLNMTEGLISRLQPKMGPSTGSSFEGLKTPNSNLNNAPSGMSRMPSGTGTTTNTAEAMKNFDTGLVRNGRVNIPGKMPWGTESSWNGNLVGPQGGASGRAAEFINNALKANKLTVSQLQQAGFRTEDLHRIMYDAEQQILQGQTPVFKTLLEQGAASDIPNATNVLSLVS